MSEFPTVVVVRDDISNQYNQFASNLYLVEDDFVPPKNKTVLVNSTVYGGVVSSSAAHLQSNIKQSNDNDEDWSRTHLLINNNQQAISIEITLTKEVPYHHSITIANLPIELYQV